MDADTEYQDLYELNTKFDFVRSRTPQHLTRRKLEERISFLLEEVSELTTASDAQDLAGIADALVDIVYVAKGTAVMLGLPWAQLWNEVHRANMEKEGGATTRHRKDLVKPPGWRPPDLTEILYLNGYRPRDWYDDAGEFRDDRAIEDE